MYVCDLKLCHPEHQEGEREGGNILVFSSCMKGKEGIMEVYFEDIGLGGRASEMSRTDGNGQGGFPKLLGSL